MKRSIMVRVLVETDADDIAVTASVLDALRPHVSNGARIWTAIDHPQPEGAARARLEGFLAKVLDKATTDQEAQGAVAELTRRLRLLHAAGETDLVLVLVTAEEKAAIDNHHTRTDAAATPGSAASTEPTRKPRNVEQEIDLGIDILRLAKKYGLFQ